MPQPPTMIGRVLSGFVIQSQLGAGGMGVVYRAHDERLGRTVAIKVLPADLRADATLKERFLREGRTAARIDHPHVVRILTAGEERGIPFLVMEHVEGGSLQKYLQKNRKLPLRHALRITRQVGSALAAAHKAGILHRDVKPANVLFTKEAEPKLVDFGLAREENSNVNLSVTGQVLGTPHYMSPEVCRGMPADARSDQYSLAIMAYLMISGRLPFDGEAAVEVLLAHLQYPVPPLREAPPPVAAAIDKALSKNAALRFGSVSEFIEALEKAEQEGMAASGPVEAPPVPVPVPASPTPPSMPLPGSSIAAAAAVRQPSYRLAYAAAGGTILLSLGLLAWMVGTYQRTKSPAPAAGGGGGGGAPVRADLGDWEAQFGETVVAAAVLMKGDDFRGALACWKKVLPPDAEQSARVERERSQVEARAAVRARRMAAEAPAGAEGAARLRSMKNRMPPEAAEILETEARRLEKDWSPKEGLPGLRRLLAGRDWDRADRELNRLAEGAGADERKKLEVARRVVKHGRMADQAVLAHFQARIGEPLTIECADGSRVTGRVHLVKAADGCILLATHAEQLTLRIQNLSTRELFERACGQNPTNEAVLAAIDLGYFCGTREILWKAAARARRRGLKLLPAQRELLDDSATKAEWLEFDALMKGMDAANDDPEGGARLAREYLRKFRDIPTDDKDLQYARDMLRAGGGVATVGDLRLYTQARVEGDGIRTHLVFPAGDEFLDDFVGEGNVDYAEGADFTIEAPHPASLFLPGLEYPEIVVVAEFRLAPGAMLALVTGRCGPHEAISTSFQAGQGREPVSISYPWTGQTDELPRDPEGWIRVEIGAASNGYACTVNGNKREFMLAHAPSGEVGFQFSGGVALRRLEVAGSPRFVTRDLDAEFEPVTEYDDAQGRKSPTHFGLWSASQVEANKLSLRAGEEPSLAHAPSWDAGDDWVAAFKARVPDGQSWLILDFRTGGKVHRRVVIGKKGFNGFVADGKFQSTGDGPSTPAKREDYHEYRLVVRDGVAALTIDDREEPSWVGHLGLAESGGFSVGVANGSAFFKDLEVRSLKR
ncbi:MAG: serine/threonine protein kinase [Planctomycetes bacterium]|nr:serine/threonine protein kinase [Planctomycetota bacterium]